MPSIIPQYEQRTRATGAANSAGPGVGGEGSGLYAIARVLEQIGDRKEQDAAADAAVTLAKVQSEWQKQLLERQEAAEPGAPEFTPTLLKDFDESAGATVAAGKTRLSKTFLKERLATYRAELADSALLFESQARIVHRKTQFADSIDLAATSAELDPDHYQQRLGEQIAALETLDVPPMEKVALRSAAVDMISGRAAIGYARRDPDGTMKRLTQPEQGDTLFRSLSPKARDAVLQEVENVQRIRINAENRAYMLAERAEKDAADAASKEGDSLLAGGKLSMGWVQRNRHRLSPDDHRYFTRKLTGGDGEGPRNVSTYVDLRERVSRGDDVRADAREALTSGAIRVEDYDRLVGEAEAQRPGWYKRGVDFISISGKPNELNPEEGAPQRLASMLDDWQVWADRNPKASDTEAREAYRRIVEEYDLVNTKNLSITLRAPRFLKGSRNQPDIEATAAETVRAYQAGEITREEFDQQAALLKRWEAASAAQAAKRAKGAEQ